MEVERWEIWTYMRTKLNTQLIPPQGSVVLTHFQYQAIIEGISGGRDAVSS